MLTGIQVVRDIVDQSRNGTCQGCIESYFTGRGHRQNGNAHLPLTVSSCKRTMLAMSVMITYHYRSLLEVRSSTYRSTSINPISQRLRPLPSFEGMVIHG